HHESVTGFGLPAQAGIPQPASGLGGDHPASIVYHNLSIPLAACIGGVVVTSEAEIRRLALACFVPGFVGQTPPGWLLRGLADGLGGVILFGSNLGDGANVAVLTDRLLAAAGRDLVLGLDEEGGDVTRLDTIRGSAAPGAAALGWLNDPVATEAVYAGIGARLAEAGVTLNLAPVADVNVDPTNPVIGVRSFSA